MSDTPKRASHEELIEGRVNSVSYINEPFDFEVDYTMESKAESALNRAWRRWQHAELIIRGSK